MYVPSLQPVDSSDFCISGDVTIHPTAVIAPGVLLQADPESCIIIGAGVCLGMGSVLHAHQGTIEVEAEATIGTGVLIMGESKIGASACIGAASTIWNHSIARGEVVPPLSLLGAIGGRTDNAASVNVPTVSTSEPTPELFAEANGSPNGAVAPASGKPAAEIQLSFSTPVYGQANLNRLLSTLLPHRQTLLKGED